MMSQDWVNIGSDNSLCSDSTKPLHETVLTNHQLVLWDSPEGNFTKNALKIYPRYGLQNYKITVTVKSSRGQWVKLFPNKTH